MTYYTFTDVNRDGTTRNMVAAVQGDGSTLWFCADSDSSEASAYLAWLSEGNTPQPWPPAGQP